MKIAVTGHRPHKLWGYNLNHDKYNKLKSMLKAILLEEEAELSISGMALGVDTVFALATLELRDLGLPIELECAIPCRNHSSKWFDSSVKVYNAILEQADYETLVSDCEYNNHVMQIRNVYMVDNCDVLIAVWDGTSGGTANCVKYAESIGKRIIRINPNTI